jgi:perosamine synthetase
MITRLDRAADTGRTAGAGQASGAAAGTGPRPYRGQRILDLLVVCLLAVPATLVGILAAAAIWLEDGSPVLFRQVRSGRDGRPFVLLKLRTMRRHSGPDLVFPDPEDITRCGRRLRRFSLDEIPQLINVALGEMSMVGPRPALPSQVQRYTGRQRRRLAVRPGLTGLAQVHGRNRLSWAVRIEWDLRYIQHQSFRLDVAVLAYTIRVVLTGDGTDGHPRWDPINRSTERRRAVPETRLRIKLAKPDVGEEEIEAIRQVFASGVLTDGPQNAAFEREFATRHGAVHAVSFANGTVALAAMLLAADIEPGDEVIVPSMTFISTATSVRHVGAIPVFADMDPRTFNLHPGDIPRLVSRRTRAVMTVHYAGQPGELDSLLDVCAEHGLPLLEDAAQAAGAEYRGMPVGTFGRSAMFSFTPTKNITTGEGGMVLTGDEETAERLRLLRNHGQRRPHEYELIGYNWRLTEMQAAMGRVQLRKLDAILARKRANAAWMTERLERVPGVTPPYQLAGTAPTHMLYTCLVDPERDRNAILERLLRRGIEAKVYFPPVHLQPVFRGHRRSLPVTEAIAGRMISLPMHAQLTPDELAEIADAVEGAVRPVAASAPASPRPPDTAGLAVATAADRRWSNR